MSKKKYEQKNLQVQELSAKLQASQSFLIYEYAGFSAKESTQLRADLKKAGFEMKVYQNNILNRALVDSGIISDAAFCGPNALVMGGDEIEPLKNIAKLAKTKSFIKLKAALVDANVIMGVGLDNFATLPTKKDLYAMICQCLQSPLRKFMHVVKQIGESQVN